LRIDSSSGADWETVLSSASSVSRICPDAPVGHKVEEEGLGAATTGKFANLEVKRRFAAVMADLDCVSGWMPKPVGRIALYDGRPDNVETTIRDQTRSGPLKTAIEVGPWGEVTVPTFAEMLRIKAWLVISRNAARDYRDTAALADRLGHKIAVSALATLDELYPQSNSASALQQLARQLAEFDEGDCSHIVEPPWNEWPFVVRRCRELAIDLLLSKVTIEGDDR
jgi:hypothetical protein